MHEKVSANCMNKYTDYATKNLHVKWTHNIVNSSPCRD